MPKYNDSVLTSAGLLLASKAYAGKTKFKLTRTATTATVLTAASIKNLTSLPNEVQSGLLTQDNNVVSGDHTLIATQLLFTNKDLTKGYAINAIGVYAQEDGVDKEILYAVVIADEAEYMPDFNDRVLLEFKTTVMMAIGQIDNVTVEMSSDNLATIQYVENGLAPKADDNTVVHCGDIDGGHNLYIERATTAGYISDTGTMSAQTAEFNELTSDFINVDPATQYLVQYWVTVLETKAWWIRVALYDANKKFISRTSYMGNVLSQSTAIKVPFYLYPTGSSETSDYYNVLSPDVKYIRVSTRKFNDGKVSVESGSLIHDWRPASEDKANDSEVVHDLKNNVNVQLNGNKRTPLFLDTPSTINTQPKKIDLNIIGTPGSYYLTADSSNNPFKRLIYLEVRAIYDWNVFKAFQTAYSIGGNAGTQIAIRYGNPVANGSNFVPATEWNILSTTSDVDGAINEAVSTANGYTDSAVASAAIKVNTFATSAANQATSAANNHADSVGSSVLSQANSHADSVGTSTFNQATAYADNAVGNAVYSEFGSGSFDCGNDFYGHGTTSRSNQISWVRSGKQLTLMGALTPVNTIPISGKATAFTVPQSVGLIRGANFSLGQGTGNAIYQLTVSEGGDAVIGRYRDTDHASAEMTPGTWLPFTTTVVLQ